MNKDNGKFAMTSKVRLLLTKKELEIAKRGAPTQIKLHSPQRLEQYVKLVRKFRDKYRDLNQRQKAAKKTSNNYRTLEKEKIFKKLLSSYRAELETKKNVLRRRQTDLDHEEHYDMDGVTRVNGKVSPNRMNI